MFYVNTVYISILLIWKSQFLNYPWNYQEDETQANNPVQQLHFFYLTATTIELYSTVECFIDSNSRH